MKSHLAIKGKNGNLALKPDASITVIDKNPMFNEVESHTYPFELPFDNNRHLMKNMDDVNSNLRASDVEGEQFTIVADNIPLRTAVMKVQEDVVLRDALSVNLDATRKTFKDMIQDLRCRDVKVDNDILIGEKIGDVEIDINVRKKYNIWYSVWYNHQYDYPYDSGTIEAYEAFRNIKATFQPPALGYSYPAKCVGNWKSPTLDHTNTIDNKTINVPKVQTSYINTKDPYPLAKYCNTRICYPHHDVEKEDNGEPKVNKENDSYISSSDIVQSDKANPSNGHDFSPYWMLDADRPASGICFYVAYFLECLFKTLGVAADMTALTNISDFNYLAFVSTSCFFDVVNTNQTFSGNDFDEINTWLSSRGCGGQIKIDEKFVSGTKEKYEIDKSTIDSYGSTSGYGYEMIQLCGNIIKIPDIIDLPNEQVYMEGWFDGVDIGNDVTINSIKACVQKMYANSENFPDLNVSEVIESLENSFGCRFCYDQETNKVTVRLLRDMFRQKDNYGYAINPIKFQGKVTDIRKKTENIRGIRMKYSAEQNAQEQQDNVRYNKRDYDTTYNYIDYKDGFVKMAAYSDWSKKIDISDYSCYVDPATGDAYRIKISSEATTVVEMKPTGFEVGQYKGVEMGDCSKEAENDGAIKEYVSQFEPIITNNLKNEEGEILLVPFVDEDMEHELVTKIIQNTFSVGDDDYIYVNYVLNLLESYDPSGTDDGQSPLMHHDWGLTIGFLRPTKKGSGEPFEFDNNYDGFGNSRWSISSKNYCLSADSFDMFGTFLGTNDAGSFSLKPRAWKPFLYYIKDGVTHITPYSDDLVGQPVEGEVGKTWLIPCNDDERNAQGIITKRIRSRGMCDTWMVEFFHFLLFRKRYEIKAQCTAAELANIPLHWAEFYDIDGKIGLFNQLQYDVNEETGIGEVTIDYFAL